MCELGIKSIFCMFLQKSICLSRNQNSAFLNPNCWIKLSSRKGEIIKQTLILSSDSSTSIAQFKGQFHWWNRYLDAQFVRGRTEMGDVLRWPEKTFSNLAKVTMNQASNFVPGRKNGFNWIYSVPSIDKIGDRDKAHQTRSQNDPCVFCYWGHDKVPDIKPTYGKRILGFPSLYGHAVVLLVW